MSLENFVRVIGRRKFFQRLGTGIAVAAVAPYASTVMGPECVAPVTGIRSAFGAKPVVDAVREGYAGSMMFQDYANFSAFSVAASLDDIVANAAKELGEAAGREITAMELRQFA